jgi:hypothetical protein
VGPVDLSYSIRENPTFHASVRRRAMKLVELPTPTSNSLPLPCTLVFASQQRGSLLHLVHLVFSVRHRGLPWFFRLLRLRGRVHVTVLRVRWRGHVVTILAKHVRHRRRRGELLQGDTLFHGGRCASLGGAFAAKARNEKCLCPCQERQQSSC